MMFGMSRQNGRVRVRTLSLMTERRCKRAANIFRHALTRRREPRDLVAITSSFLWSMSTIKILFRIHKVYLYTCTITTMTCRICFEPDDLISVCGCKGTLQYVHKECIERWKKDRDECELCHEPYRDDTSFCPIVAWLVTAAMISAIQAFILWRETVYFPNNLIDMAIAMGVFNLAYCLMWICFLHYGSRYCLIALSLMVLTFFPMSFVMQVTGPGFESPMVRMHYYGNASTAFILTICSLIHMQYCTWY